MIFNNKKGLWSELLYIIVFLFAFTIISVFIYKAFNGINIELQQVEQLSNESKAIVNNAATGFPSLWDGIGAFILVGLWAFTLLAAYNSQYHPLWGVLSIFIIVTFGFVSMVLANAYASIYENVAEAASFPLMNFFLSNYLTVVLVFAGSAVLVLFLSNKSGG